jgi:hypothetical protein
MHFVAVVAHMARMLYSNKQTHAADVCGSM